MDMIDRVLEHYEIRKTKKQKAAFAELVRGVAEERGLSFRTEKGSFGARNLVVGDPDRAQVVLTAHYDTCARAPFPNFITPTSFTVYLLYQLLITFGFFLLPIFLVTGIFVALAAWLGAPEALLSTLSPIVAYVLLLLMLWLLMAGPANRHTVNDNTSGVTVLLELMQSMPEELCGEVAYVFFDLEELGLFGSKGFAARHRRAMRDKLLINFDCVSDGDTMLFAVRRGAKRELALLERAFAPTESMRVEIRTRGVFYPSDQASFPCGVGVAALKRSRVGLLYMNRIHTPRDTVWRAENVAFLRDGSIALVRGMSERAASQTKA